MKLSEVVMAILDEADAYENSLPPLPPVPHMPEGSAVAAYIDHTLLTPEATAEQIRQLCQEAHEYGFASVCINPVFVPLARGLLKGSPVKVCTVVGFPLGAAPETFKVYEAQADLESGAAEVDMVINIGAIKGEAYGQVYHEVEAVCIAAHAMGGLVKVIIETALLTRREKIIASLICKAAGADFVKTSTGFSSGGATVDDIALIRSVVGPELGVKAAGGVRSYADAIAMIRAGATRLGASAGVTIMKQAQAGEVNPAETFGGSY
jgi:deoxyribose-phosphate aldolase